MHRKLGLGSFLVALSLVGCGGSHSSSHTSPGRGTAVLKVIWPDRAGRLVPLSANSVRIVLTSRGTSVADALVARPTDGTTETTTEFTNLPVGVLDVAVTAYPNADGTGVGQAVGTSTLTTSASTPANATVALTSTAVSLLISPSSPEVGQGTSTTLTATAVDANGHDVPLSSDDTSESIVWSVSDPTIATITGTGPTATLSGLRAGSVEVTATLTVNDDGDTVTGTGNPTVVAASGTVVVR